MNKNTKHIDEVFQQRFQSFEVTPPEQVWEQIKINLPSNNSGTLFSNPVSLASIAAILLIALFMGVNLFKQPTVTTKKVSQKAPVEQKSSVAGTDVQDETKNDQPKLDNNKETENNSTIPNPENNKKDIVKGPKTTFGKTFKETDNRDKTQLINLQANNTQKIPNDFSYSLAKGNYPKHFLNPNGISNDYYKRKPEWQLGVYLTPEIMFYPDDNIQNQSGYHFDLSISYQFSDFFIESGLGLNFAKDVGDYQYEKYLGSYEDVYYVTFDTSTGGPIPTYHTNTVEVFDTTETYRPTTNRYTYLEVPILFGFKKQVNRFTYFVKAGPSFAFMIHKNIPEDGSKDKFARPYRKNTNTQIILGAGVSYRIHKNFSLSAEPTLRYYINSAYERRFIKSNHNYSVGFRAGLIYHF